MSEEKVNCPPGTELALKREMSHFLRLKEKETERSRLRALEAMILLEQRKRGAEIVKTEIEKTKATVNVGSQYTDDGKLKFSAEELESVQRLRDRKAERIESFLKKQNNSKKRIYLGLNQRFPFILKGDEDKLNVDDDDLKSNPQSKA